MPVPSLVDICTACVSVALLLHYSANIKIKFDYNANTDESFGKKVVLVENMMTKRNTLLYSAS